MTAIDRIASHFDSLAKRKIIVPEWGDLEIYATPMTLADRSQIYRGVDSDDGHTPLVRVLIIKARDAEGRPLFSIADQPKLMNRADPVVVVRVANEILNGEAPKADELGNS